MLHNVRTTEKLHKQLQNDSKFGEDGQKSVASGIGDMP